MRRDLGRLSVSRKAVRMAGIDIGVHRSDRRSRVGKLNRQGSAHLRWALYEAAPAAGRPSSPDHADYLALKDRGPLTTAGSAPFTPATPRRLPRFRPAPGKCCGSRHPAATRQRPSGRSHSTRTDRSTITSPTTRSRTQISPGIHGADQPTTERNHSPPRRLTEAQFR
jgi:hypothetical protein